MICYSADDCDLVSHTAKEMQDLINVFDSTCDAFGLSINLKKIVIMYQPTPEKIYIEPDIYLRNDCLKVVDIFVYLGNTLSRKGDLDVEITSRLQKAADGLGKLESRLWSKHNINMSTKIFV